MALVQFWALGSMWLVAPLTSVTCGSTLCFPTGIDYLNYPKGPDEGWVRLLFADMLMLVGLRYPFVTVSFPWPDHVRTTMSLSGASQERDGGFPTVRRQPQSFHHVRNDDVVRSWEPRHCLRTTTRIHTHPYFETCTCNQFLKQCLTPPRGRYDWLKVVGSSV